MVLAVGDDTMMGAIEQTLNTYDEPTSFEREMNSISLALDPLDACHGSNRVFRKWIDRWRLARGWSVCLERGCRSYTRNASDDYYSQLSKRFHYHGQRVF